MSNTVVVNSEKSLQKLIQTAVERFEEDKYIVWSWKKKSNRTLSQNALLHVWLTEYCAHLLGIDKDSVTPSMIEVAKKTAKRKCYAETAQEWLIETVPNPLDKGKLVNKLTSSASWSPEQCFYFMEWLQSIAANDGLILESKGEYLANYKRGQV